ncbi:MAG: PA2779 family protein, partial [Pseudomonadota bacterium]
LRSMLDRDDVKASLQRMGVDPAQVDQRINNLTQQELASFNDQLAQAPAGEGVVGVIVLFVLVFIVTDMLCATNIFSFVRCIN